MSKFLDETGLSYFWSKVKTYLATNFLQKPSGGSSGQVLTKSDTGESWGDVPKEILKVTFSNYNSGTATFGTVTHNAKEIYQAQSEGKIVIACNLDAMFYAPLSTYYQYSSGGDTQTYELHFTSGEAHLSYTQMYDAGGSLLAEQSYFGGLIVSADGVTFDNEGTEFESTNVQAALEEIGTKIPSANGTAGQVWTKTETGAEWADTSGSSGSQTTGVWELYEILDNSGAMSGTWTAPDVYNGHPYDLGIYMIGGGASGGIRVGYSNACATGGASGYGKNFIINGVTPGAQYSYVIGAGGDGISTTSTSNGNSGGTTSFNGITVDGGSGGISGASTSKAAGANGGQGSTAAGEKQSRVYGCTATSDYQASSTVYANGGQSQSAKEGQNQFDPVMVTLCAGGWANKSTVQTLDPLPDNTKGGDGARNTNGIDATGYGNGGGAVSKTTTGAVTSGAGSDGAIFIYTRQIPLVEYEVSITVLDQDSNPVDGIPINGLLSDAEGASNGRAVTNSSGVATGICYNKVATFTTDEYTDLSAGTLILSLSEDEVTSGTINVTFNNFVRFTSTTVGIRFSRYVKRIDVSAAGGGGGGVQLRLTAGNNGEYGVSSGGAGGYAVCQYDVDFQQDVEYTATVGSGGAVVTTSTNPPKGGTSTFLGVSAEGGAGGNYGNMSVAAIGNGNGGACSESYQTIAPTAGTQQIFSSFTEMKTVGGGGACGDRDMNSWLPGASPNGAHGARVRRDDEEHAGSAGVSGGGGGMAYDYEEDSNGDNYHGQGNPSAGGRGEIAIRLYNTHTIPAA